jgi:hypothetical protein
MGALIFYTVIYFLGFFAAYLLNQMAGRSVIRNRRLAGLVLVLMVAVVHASKIISTPPPHHSDIGAGSALGWYVILPVAIIVIVVAFLTWQEGQDDGG